MAKVVIFGCGRGADVAARYLSADSQHEVVAFTVDQQYMTGESFRGLPLVDFAKIEQLYPPQEHQLFAPLGFQRMNAARAEKYLEGKRKGYTFISYISSKVATHDTIQAGENCFILENNTINFDVRIGNNVVIWSTSQIGDQTIIANHAWISSATISGGVRIGEYCFLGVNCTVADQVTIAAGCYIGAGVLIAKDTVENGVYVVEGTKLLPVDSSKFLSMISVNKKTTHS